MRWQGYGAVASASVVRCVPISPAGPAPMRFHAHIRDLAPHVHLLYLSCPVPTQSSPVLSPA